MSNNYRAPWHDYSGKGIYHITICKEAGVEDFSAIVGDARLAVGMHGSAAPKYTRTGCAISRCLRKIPQIHPAMWLMQYVIMPDHLHLLLQVKEPMDEILGRKIAIFKVMVNKEAETDRTFSKGFNDRIIPPSQDLGVVYDYIKENPRRLLIRRVFPEYFSRVNRLRIGERLYQAYGNLQLLKSPFMEAVIVHRADSAAVIKKKMERWLYLAANGGVLVSAFVSKDEKEAFRQADSLEGKFILMKETPMTEREKPTGHLYELCSAGRLLLLVAGDEAFHTRGYRDQCLAMNRYAEEISGLAAKGLAWRR